jgi:hypothetical protein
MKTIEIKAKEFFEMMKQRDTSMWSIFAQLINDQEEQLIVFQDAEGKEIAHYILPTSVPQMEEDRKMFAETFKEKIAKALN